MKILLLTNSMKQPDDEFAGKTDVVFSFAREWANAGHEVVVIHNETKFPVIYYKMPKYVYSFLQKKGNVSIPSIKSRQRLKREESGIKIYRIPMLKFVPHVRYLGCQYKKQIELIEEYLSEINFKPDVITGHWIEPQLKLINELGKKFNAKTGFVIHGELPNKLSEEYKKYINNLDCFFLRSEAMRRKTVNGKFSEWLPSNVSVCYSGIPNIYVNDIVRRDDWKANNRLNLVYVGRLVAYKRIDAVLKALSMIKIDFHLDIVGDGVEREALENLSKKLSIADRVFFHGRVSRNDVQAIMRKSDCFVMISENEVFGLVYLEAMAAGCVTIASVDGGVDGIIKNNENGFLINQGDDRLLANLLEKINKMNLDEVSKIRENAYETITDFTDSCVAEKYLQDICYGI